MNKTTTLVLAAIAGFGLSAQARTTTNGLWTVNFEGVTTSQETGIAKLADLDASAMEEAFTDGAWTVQSDDDSYVTNVVGATGPNRLELDTQGNDLTWTPTSTGLQGNRSITEMDVRFVAADDAPDGFDSTSVQTAFFVQNIYTNAMGETEDDPQFLQLYAWTWDTAGSSNHWEAVGAPFAASFADSMHHVQILIDYRDDYNPYLHVAVDGTEVTGEGVVAANYDTTKTTGKMTAVTFKGTGTIDNFTGTRLYTDFAEYDFTAEVYMDGEFVPASSADEPKTQVQENVKVGDYDDPTHHAEFADLPVDDAGMNEPTYSLARVVIVDLSTGNETTYAYTYDKVNYEIVPVSTACPVLDVDGGLATLSPYTYGATNDSVIAKLYYNTLDAYFASAVVNVGEDSATFEKFVKPTDADTTVSWTFPTTTNGTYVLRSVVVANGATFDSSTGVVSFTVPEGGIGSDKTYATVTYVEGGYDAEALEWVYDAGTGTYTLQRKTFTVTWMNGEDTLAETNGVAYGDVPEYYGAEPTKASTAQYDYAFAGWTPAVIAATSNATYNASFTETVRSYDITWVADGNADQVTSVAYGDTPVAPEVTAPEGKVLDGWTPAIVAVTGATTYTAVFVDAAPDVATVISIADGTTHNYKSLAAALAAANAGDTVLLLTNAVVDSTVSISKNLVLDLGGNWLSNTVVRSGEPLARTLQANTGNVVVTNGTVYGRVNCYDDSTLTIAANTTVEGYVLVWGDGTYGEAGCKTPTLNVYGTIDGGSDVVLFNGNGDTSKPNINVFPGAVLETDYTSYAITLREANFTMTGGTIDANWGIFATNATIAVSGGTFDVGNRAIDADYGTAVTISGGAINAEDSGIGLWNGSSLTMTGGSITADSFGVFNNGMEKTGTTMAISGGTITSTNSTACGIYQAGKGSLTLSGTAVVSGADAVEVRAGTVQVLSNAQLIATAPYSPPSSNGGGSSGHGGVALLVSQHTTTNAVSATVSGGTLQGAVAFEEATVESNADPTVVSGTITGGTILGDVLSEDVDNLIPSTSEARFADADAEGVQEGYGLKPIDGTDPQLYAVEKTYVVTYANYDGAALQVTTNFVGETTPAYAGATPVKPADASGIYAFTGFGTIAETVTADATYTAQFSTTTSKATVISIADGSRTYYPDFDSAVEAAAAGDTVLLLDDAAATRVTVEKNLVIDLGGHTYTGRLSMFDGNVVVTNGTVAGRFDVYDSSVVTLAANTTVDGYVIVWGDGVYGEAGCKTPTFNLYGTVRNNDPETTDEYAISTSSDDDSRPVVNIYEGAVVETIWAGVGIRNGASLNMTGGSITAGEFGIYNNGSDTTPTTINVSGGTVTSTNEVDTACGIYQAGPGALTLSGTAVIRGPDAVEVRAGTVQVLSNAQLIATMSYTGPASNGNGNSGHGGVALLVSQHTTTNAVTATVSGGTLQGPVAFEEASVESNADPTVVSGEIAGGTILGDVKSEDIDDLIPSDSEALFADADAEGVEDGYGLQEDPENPGLYKVVKTYVVTYANYDGTALQVTTNFVGDATPAYAGATPVKDSDSQYDYSFTGWSPVAAATVTEDATYVAQFSAKENGTVIVITDNGATTNYFATLQAALDDVKENNLQQANIELLADASITISRNGNVLGGNSTTNITINGNDHELHVVRDGTWAQFNTANDATLVLNDVSLTSEFTGTQTGWVGDTLQNPNHNIAFNCDVELKDVDSDTALSFWKDADLDTVTIAETVDVYSIWIHTTASNVAIKDLVVDSPNGRGIKVDDSFVKYAGTPSASTAISIDGASFTTKNRKSAVLVRSAYPIDITTAGTIDISNVPADTQHLVWVDEDASENFGLVTFNGAQSGLGVEGGASSYAASLTTNAWIAGYYKVLADAVEVATADDTVTLLKDSAETFTVSKELTITRNGFSAENVTAGEGYQRTDTAETYVFAEESQDEGHIGAKSEEGFVILAPADDDYDTTKPLTFAAPDLTAGTVAISASMICPDGVDEVTLTLLYKTDLTAATYSKAQVTVTDIDPVAGTATVELPSGLGDTVFFFGFSNEAGVVDTTPEP